MYKTFSTERRYRPLFTWRFAGSQLERRYLADLLYKHFKLAQAIWRYRGFVERLKKDPNARNYTDVALTPVVDDDFDSFEMFTASESAKSAGNKLRRPRASRAASSAGGFKPGPSTRASP